MTCPQCGGKGWIIVERGDVSGADPCPTCHPRFQSRRENCRVPTETEFSAAALYLARVVDYGPKDDEIMVELAAHEMREYVSTKAQLEELIHTAKYEMRAWSLRDLRAIFCRMFPPKDGRYPEDPNAGEMRSIAESGRKFFERFAEYKQKAIAAPTEAKTAPTPPPRKPPRKLGDPRPVLMQGDVIVRETLKETEDRLAQEMKEAEPHRTPEDRARLIADIEAQLKLRMTKK